MLMKNHILKFLLLLIGLVIISTSCSKEPKYENIDIKVMINDDVSPIWAQFWIDTVVSRTEWHINDTIIHGFDGWPKEEPVLEYRFDEEGHYTINLFAEKFNKIDHFFTNKIELEIPEIANKLIVYGIDLNNNDMGFNDEDYSLTYQYVYDSETHVYKK